MKKLFSIAIATLMAAGIAAIPLTARADVQAITDAQPTAETETAKVYLLPGSYLKDGERVQNTVANGTALTAAEKESLHLEGNVYEAGTIGDSLPLAVTTQKDKAGNAYTFNGWWYILDATVTYTDVVPEVTETTYLYADFRADLSQRKDPVAPAPKGEEELKNFIRIIHEDGTQDDIKLNLSATDQAENAQPLDGGTVPVQFGHDWLEFKEGDKFQIWVSGYFGSDEPLIMPHNMSDKYPIYVNALLEIGGKGVAEKYFAFDNALPGGSYLNVEDPTFKYTSDETHIFRCFFKVNYTITEWPGQGSAYGCRLNIYFELKK